MKASIERDEEKSNGAKVKMDQPLRGMPHPFDKLHPRMYAAEFADRRSWKTVNVCSRGSRS